MDKKRGFSLLELLIVIAIIWICFVAFKSAFEIKNKDTLYAQACIETIYGQVNNFIYGGLSSKSLFSWTTAIFPQQYSISFNPTQQTIQLKYATGDEIVHIYSSIAITGNGNTSYCSSNRYTILMTWASYDIYINKWLTENTALQSFYLSGANLVNTGGNDFVYCTPQGNECKTIARFQIDTRSLSLQKQMCLYVNSTGDCEERDN